MELRFRPIAKVTATNLLPLIPLSSLLFAAFVIDIFPKKPCEPGKRLDRQSGEAGPSIPEKPAEFHERSTTGFSDLHRIAIARGNNSITGFVFSEARRPIPNIHVELLNDVGAAVSRTKTAASGLFAFRGLGEGVFYVKVLPYNLNYVGAERRVPLISVSARPGFGSVSEQVDFYLQPKTASSTPFAEPGVVFVQEVPKDAERLYEEGIEFISSKSEEQGFEKLRKAIEAFPKYFAALDRLGNEYVLKGHYRPAVVLLSEAIKINPKSYSSSFGLGLAQFRLNDLEQAIAYFDRSIELYRESVQANLWRGISLHALGKHNEAEKSLKVAGKLSKGDSPDVHWQLARVYKDQGRLTEAVAELELLLKLKPDAADADEIKKTIALLKEKSKPAS